MKLPTTKHKPIDLLDLLTVLVFLLVLVLNCLTVPVSDDYGYSISSGLGDILHREYLQYMNWTGRTVAHLIARIFLALPKPVFNVANSLCFTLLTRILLKHVSQKEPKPAVYLFLVLGLFLFAPFFGQTVLWETGSCNYLWTTTIIVSFLLLYRRTDRNHHALPVFLAGIASGWTNENTAGAMILLIIFFLVFYFREKKAAAKWQISGLCGSLIGYLMMMLAPGNNVRAAEFLNDKGHSYEIIHDFTDALTVIDRRMIVPWLVFAAGFAFLLFEKKDRENAFISSAFAAAALACVGAMIFSPVQVVYDRSMFGSCIFLLIACGIGIDGLEKSDFRFSIRIVAAVMVLFSSLRYLRAGADLIYTRYQYINREIYVADQKEAGNLNPVVPQLYREFETDYNPYHGLSDLSIYRKQSMNVEYSLVHGIESVQSTPMDRWNLIYRDGDSLLQNETVFDSYYARLMNHPEYTVLVTSSLLDEGCMDYLKHMGISFSGDCYVAGLLSGEERNIRISDEPEESSWMIGSHYCYISAAREPRFADIVIDGQEYTNDNAGLTLVVFDPARDRVVDSVTFSCESDQDGVRYYSE